MIKIRRSEERGKTEIGWLKGYHSFSFGDYYDPENMGFGPLRVINEDYIEPGQGFGTHPHRDMEIVTYVLEGTVEHRDSMGNHGLIKAGELQRITAGSGISHSEFNHSKSEKAHLLQIWFEPNKRGLTPGYQQVQVSGAPREKMRLIASGRGKHSEITVNQDIDLVSYELDAGEQIQHNIESGRGLWLQVVRGEVNIEGDTLNAGDSAAITAQSSLALTGKTQSEVLLFDLVIN